MPSFFPNGQDSWTNKTDNVTTVFAADVNNLQNAVAQLEIGGVSMHTITYAATITPNCPDGQFQTVTLTGNVTVAAPTNATTGRVLELLFIQDATGGRTVTWNAVFTITNWAINLTASAATLARFVYNGSNWILAPNPPTTLVSLNNPWIDITHPAYGADPTGVLDSTVAINAALAALPASGGRLRIPSGTYTCATPTAGVVLTLLNKSFATIEGDGRTSILNFKNVTATDGFRIEGCTHGTFRDFQVQVSGTSVITNAIQYTTASPGSAEQSVFERVQIVNKNYHGRWAYDVQMTNASAVITSAQAIFAAGDVGGAVGMKQNGPPLASSILSVATLTGTVNNGGAMTAGQTSVPMLGAITGAPANAYTIKIDSEIMLVTAGFQTATLTVTRGYAGTTAATHVDASTVTTYQATLNDNSTFTNDGTLNAKGLGWIFIQTPTSASMQHAFAHGTDHPGATNVDASGTTFLECEASGALVANWRLGNGSQGNVLNVYHYGCVSNLGSVACLMAGCSTNWVGGGVGETGTDFLTTMSASNPFTVTGCRSENSGVFFENLVTNSSALGPASIRNVEVELYKAADTVPIRLHANSGITLDLVTIRRSVVGGGVQIAVAGNNAQPISYVALNVSTDGSGNPHPAASATIQRTIIGGTRIDPATVQPIAGGNTWGTIIDGHITSAMVGVPATSNLGANITSVTFTGNDTRGQIVIVVGVGGLAANTRIATCTWAVTFLATTFPWLVNQTSGVGLAVVNFYSSAETATLFDLFCNQALVAGTYAIRYGNIA